MTTSDEDNQARVDDVAHGWKESYRLSIEALELAMEIHDGGNFNQRRLLEMYREGTERALACFRDAEKSIDMAVDLTRGLFEINTTSSNSRWTEDELVTAVELRCHQVPLEYIARMLGRTTQSVATKLSSAVGIRRIEQKIRGMFSGTLNEQEIQGKIEGVLRK